MSIIIKGMEMPKSCFECRFSIDGFCQAMEPGARTDDDKAQVSNWCPLVEVPTPHGRLIEAERLMHKLIRYGGVSSWSEEELYYTIKDMDTIIEAEESDGTEL